MRVDTQESAAAGETLFEYRPARLGPMTVALLFILGLATPFAALDRLLADQPEQAAFAAIPLGLVVLFGWLTTPSPLRVRTDAVVVSRSRAARILGAKTTIRLSEIDNVYPTFYEDVGMRLSPFASAEGTARHAGLGIETSGGERLIVAFTPTVLNLRRHGTPPYHAALQAVRDACARAGRPLVTRPPPLSQEAVDRMLLEAARPLLPFPVTVGGIFAPAALIPALGWLTNRLWGPVPSEVLLAIALVGLSPLLAVFGLVAARSHRRAQLLHEVQKYREHLKERPASPPAGPA